MHVALIVKRGDENTGLGRYAKELEQSLLAAGCRVTRVYPQQPLPPWLMGLIKRTIGWDLAAVFNNFPVAIRYPKVDIYHFTNQNLATLLVIHKPRGKTIVTVADIIPHIFRNDPELHIYQNRIEKFIYQIVMRGIKHADGVVTISEHTRDTLIDQLGMRPEAIWPVHLAVG